MLLTESEKCSRVHNLLARSAMLCYLFCMMMQQQGLMGRMLARVAASLVGLALLAGAAWLLFWNEGRAVKTAQALEEGRGVVCSLSGTERVDAAMEGRLVHATGVADTQESVSEPDFGFSVPCMRLERRVEYYQWVEEKDTHHYHDADGRSRSEIRYSYHQKWVDRPVNSGHFRHTHHRNTVAVRLCDGARMQARVVAFGAFCLNADQIARAGEAQPLPSAEASISAEWTKRAAWSGNTLYIGQSAPARAESPQVGDVRVSWYCVPQQVQLSLVAQQRGNSFVPYQAKSGYAVDLLENGVHSAAAMFERAVRDNELMTWLLRAVGTVLMLVGVCMVLSLARSLVAWVPLLGGLLECGILLAGIAGGLLLSLVSISLAWMVYRPLLAAGLIFFGVMPAYYLLMRRRKRPVLRNFRD